MGRRSRQKGISIIVTLMVAGVVSILGIGVMSRVHTSSQSARETRWGDLAFSAAVAGGERMLSYLQVRDSNGKMASFSSAPGRTTNVTRIGGQSITPPFNVGSSFTLQGDLGQTEAQRASYEVTASLLETDIPRPQNDVVFSRWRVTSVGEAGGIRKTVSMIVRSAFTTVRPSAGLSVGGQLRVAGDAKVLGGGTWERWTTTKAAAAATDSKIWMSFTSGMIRKDTLGFMPPSASTTLNGAHSAGATTIALNSAAGFAVGDAIVFMDADSSKYEAGAITAVSGNNVTIGAGTKFDHASGTSISKLIKKSIPDLTTAINDYDPSVTFASGPGVDLASGTTVFKFMPTASSGGNITLNGSNAEIADPKIANTDAPSFEEMFGMSQSEFKKLCTVMGNSEANAHGSNNQFKGWNWIDTSKDTGTYQNINLSQDIYGEGILIIDAGSRAVTIAGGYFEGVIFCVSGDMDFSGGFEVRGAVASMGGTVTTDLTGNGNKITYDPSKLPDGSDSVFVKANRTWEWRTN